MHSDGGGQRGAAVLLLYTLTFGLSAAVCATAEEPDASDSAERYGIDPARLGAVSAASRALFVEVLDRLGTMRGEMDGLRADKAALAERPRVARLEEKDCETFLPALLSSQPPAGLTRRFAATPAVSQPKQPLSAAASRPELVCQPVCTPPIGLPSLSRVPWRTGTWQCVASCWLVWSPWLFRPAVSVPR